MQDLLTRSAWKAAVTMVSLRHAERLFLGVVVAGLVANFLWVGLLGLGLTPVPAMAIAGLACPLLAIHAARKLPDELDRSARRHPISAVACGLGAALALLATARLSLFITDPSHTSCATLPFSGFNAHHSCVSSYFEAARFASEGTPNVYDSALYDGPTGRRFLNGLVVDRYEYPPPFLLLPRAVQAFTIDFVHEREVWYALTGATLLGGFFAVARWIGGPSGLRLGLLTPLAWLSLPTLSILQFGNFHTAVFALSMLAMVAFERDKNALGGMALAFAALGKIFPGLLVVYLVSRRKWKAVGFTAGFGVLYLVLSLVLFGSGPLKSFVSYQLPHIESGEAFRALQQTAATKPVLAANLSISSTVLKLKLLGVPSASMRAANVVGWIYTLLLVALPFVFRRDGDRASRAAVWFSILMLASWRSPFVGQSTGLFPLAWLLIVVFARFPIDLRRAVLLGLGAVVVNLALPLDTGISPPLLAVISFVQLGFGFALVSVAMKGLSAHGDTEGSPPVAGARLGTGSA